MGAHKSKLGAAFYRKAKQSVHSALSAHRRLYIRRVSIKFGPPIVSIHLRLLKGGGFCRQGCPCFRGGWPS